MDVLTHAFSVIFLSGSLDILLVCFGVMGTVLPDIDILLQRFSKTDPRLYIFSHGGITHSIAGAYLLSVSGFSSVFMLQLAGFLTLPEDLLFWISGLGMITAGAFLHITLDYLACPGIPLFYPFSDKKYTLGIFAGPSLFLTALSIVFFILFITGFTGAGGIYIWGLIFFGYLAFSFIKKGILAGRFRGRRTIPTFNPLQWIVVSESKSEYTVSRYSVTGGIYRESVYKKHDDVRDDEIKALDNNPEMKRLRYFSYLVVFERREGSLRAYDPLRISGLIFYPPDYREYKVKKP